MNSENKDTDKRLVAKNANLPVWCPGCGDFGVLQALVKTLQDLGKTPQETVIVSGIGCSGRLPYFVDAYGFHSLHGRALPAALGIKKANPELTVIVVGGDGDGFGIGGGHVPHIARRNIDITYLVLDNGVYALTKGHSSPTTEIGQKTPSARQGEEMRPLEMMTMLLAYKTSFVASTYSGDRPRLSSILQDAILHPGFATVRIMSPCPTYNPWMSYDNLRETLKKVPDEFDASNLSAALSLSLEHNGMLDGIIYRESLSPFEQSVTSSVNNKEYFQSLVQRYV